jgi:hypothetical protein
MKKIKTCIIVDPAGAAGKGPEEEVENHIKVYSEMIAPAKMTPYTALYPSEDGRRGIQTGTQLLIYDFGGMIGSSDLMESNAFSLIRWAADNPKALVIVASGFTYRNFVKLALEDEALNLLNVVVDDGRQEDPIPFWWRLENDLPVPDPEKVYAAQMEVAGPTPGELEAERLAAEEQEEANRKLQVAREKLAAEDTLDRKKHEETVAYITLPVRCDGKPGDRVHYSRLKVADSMVDVTDDKTGKDIAHFGGAFGGVYECNFPDGKGSLWGYSISPYAFWDAFKKMHEDLTGQTLPEVTR